MVVKEKIKIYTEGFVGGITYLGFALKIVPFPKHV